MYTAQDFKSDLLANLKSDANFSNKLKIALDNSEFEFEDSADYTHLQWNTYTRVLTIFCRTMDKAIIDVEQKRLYQYIRKLHGVKDDFIIMEIKVFIRRALDDTVITQNEIVITKKVVIDKANDYVNCGGFASIYKKKDPQTGIEYAFKIFDPSPFQGSDSKTMKKRFIREAKKLMGYAHENIIRAYDFGFLGDESAYIKLEYIDGEKVYDYIKGSFLDIEDKNKLAMQYISAMAYIHSKADIHRDISYSNIMITNDGNIKVLDFGFSKNNEDTTYDTLHADILHKFNPPDTTYDIRTEVYCMGAILFTIFTEQDFHISKITEIDNADCSETSKMAIKKCLEINPVDRFQSAIELLDFLIENENQTIGKQTVINQNTDFSLDEFNSIMNNIQQIRFDEGEIPTFSTIKEWVEIKFPDSLAKHRFLSKMNITYLLTQIPKAKSALVHNNFDCNIDKKLISDICEAYEGFSEPDRTSLIKGIHTIIILKAVGVEDLPF